MIERLGFRVRALVHSLCAAALLASIGPGAARADGEEWVEVTGEAAVVEDNEVHAREMALQQALRQSVEMVAGTIVSGISETSRFISVRDEITSQAAGYVRRYEIEDTVCGEGTCKVTVRALVAKRRLSERLSDLGLLVQQRGYPRVIMLITEQNAGDEEPTSWWSSASTRSQILENVLVGYLNKVLDEEDDDCERAPPRDDCWTPLEHGMRFTFMDYRSVSAAPVVEEAQAGVDLTDEQARQIARLTDAEVALIGRAAVASRGEIAMSGGVTFPLRATLSLRILDVPSARLLGTVNLDVSHRHPSPIVGGTQLLETLGRRAAPEIQRHIAESWQAEATGVRRISLEIDGLGGFNDLTEFRSLLSTAVTGVRSVTTTSMSGGKASLELQATIGAEQLAAELSTRPLGRFNVRVTSFDSASVGINLGR